ncbi:MAG: glutaredoxin family protein [Actinobacteria bacterium]|nr:MAG: glutaredoxin family protein [Actinomycetota bacterium]TMM10425.1 MAG: glutaredoxin family protein [Actinomycetota bacterium]
MTILTLYGKPGCHLCHEARAEIERVRAERPFDLEEIDVSLDPGLQREYGERIPVVAIGGEDVLELRVRAEELRRLLDTVPS